MTLPDTARKVFGLQRSKINFVPSGIPYVPGKPPPIRKVAFDGKGSLEKRIPDVHRYNALPVLNLRSSQIREGTSPRHGLPTIRKVGLGWSPDWGKLRIRKVKVDRYSPFDEDSPYNPEAPVKMTAPGHQSNLDEKLAAVAAAAENPQVKKKSKSSKNNLAVEGHRIERPDVKTTYVDTHCHLVSTLQMLIDNSGDGETIPQNALDTFVKTIFPPQVTAVVDIHCDLPLKDYHEKAATLNWPDHFKYHFSIGVHPHCAMSYTDEVHESLVKAMSHPSCVAWGECGLDYFKNHISTHPTQRAVFARQLAAAVELGKPIVVHTREADEDTLAAIRENVPKDHRIHVHCFTSGPTLAKTMLKEYPNSYIGITGVISYNGIDHVNQLIRSGEIPVERMLLETDSPYMVPKKAYEWLVEERPQDRKKRFLVSHSGMIPFTVDRIVEEINRGRKAREEKEITLDEVLDITRGNAAKMYGIDV